MTDSNVELLQKLLYKNINICRICLQEHQDCVNLFSESEMYKDFINNIYLCTQILFVNKKYLPNKICNSCVREFESANAFRLKCLISEESVNRYNVMLETYLNNKTDVGNSLIDDYEVKNDIELSADTDLLSDTTELLDSKENIVLINDTNIQKQYICDICDKILKTSKSLKSHKMSMHQKRKSVGKITGHGASRMYHCVKCSYSTKHGQSLVYHMRTHTGEKPFMCKCGKQFTQPSSLAAHQKTHSEHTYYTCPQCGKQFKFIASFKNHQRVHEEGTFTCNICKKILKSNQSMKAHMQRHYNIRNYSCDACGATFVTSAELLNHKKKHDIEKKFQCHLCSYKTHLKKILIVHIKRCLYTLFLSDMIL